MQMHSNDTNRREKILHKDLSYQINGLLFKVHNELGRFCREKQYGDAVEQIFTEYNISFEREKSLPVTYSKHQGTNRVDFTVNNKILLDIKAKPFITKEDYYQMQRYLQAIRYELGLVVNFRNRYLKPIRIIRIDS